MKKCKRYSPSPDTLWMTLVLTRKMLLSLNAIHWVRYRTWRVSKIKADFFHLPIVKYVCSSKIRDFFVLFWFGLVRLGVMIHFRYHWGTPKSTLLRAFLFSDLIWKDLFCRCDSTFICLVYWQYCTLCNFKSIVCNHMFSHLDSEWN